VNTSTASIAKANTSADLDVVGGLEPASPGGLIISGASHREDPRNSRSSCDREYRIGDYGIQAVITDLGLPSLGY